MFPQIFIISNFAYVDNSGDTDTNCYYGERDDESIETDRQIIRLSHLSVSRSRAG